MRRDARPDRAYSGRFGTAISTDGQPNRPSSARVENVEVAGVSAREYLPATPSDGRQVIWVHGGAFVPGTLDAPESDAVARALAAQGFSVTTVAYRLVPRGPRVGRASVRYPAPLDDVCAVLREVQGRALGPVVLGGASAGACLAAGAIMHTIGAKARLPDAAFFAYGVFHARLPARDRVERIRVPGHHRFTHHRAFVHLMNRNYAGSRGALLQPTAFPGGNVIDAFPPTLIVDAEHDTLRASGEAFAKELAASDTAVRYDVVADARHAFLNRPHDPAFRVGVGLITDWLRNR